MNALLHNQIVVFGGIGFLLTVVGVVFTRKKLLAFGLSISQAMNKWVGKKNEEAIEDKLQEILDGMKSDNEAKK